MEVLGEVVYQNGSSQQTVSHILATDSAVCVVMNVEGHPSRVPILEDVKNGKTNMIGLAACSPLNISRTRRDLNDVSATNWNNRPASKELPVIPLLVNYPAP
jgi:hypothetical protein